MKSWTRVQAIILVLVLLFLAGCSTATPDSQSSPLPTPGAPPASPEQASPTAATPSVLVEGLPFSLDKPLTNGDTEVSGTGPIGVPILIADLTIMGEVMGRGTIDSDGLFDIALGTPLITNHRIGILLDPETTEFEFTTEILDQIQTFKGEGAINLPRIGLAYDAASVVP